MARGATLHLTLVRHGATDWNGAGRWQGWTDTPLGETGRIQAGHLARRWSRTSPDAVYASDLQRALDTAALALPDHRVIPDARLRELHFGRYEGATTEDVLHDPEYAQWQRDPWTRPAPGGESLRGVAARMRDWAAELPAGDVIAFTHGAALRALLCDLFGWPAAPQPGYVLPFPYRHAHTGLTRLMRTEGRWLLLTYNDHAHLEAGAD
ncbi:histidine phosphatase family protein [Deinococcus aestuarii]|uniref:histidine phosphatase family protein n=1 Tax=Deinococcus aestuarii TaxID=2774531 RepID=UPI001C0E47F7|nr:histidine phosphatase family protein [Deinococcus aestuarii]